MKILNVLIPAMTVYILLPSGVLAAEPAGVGSADPGATTSMPSSASEVSKSTASSATAPAPTDAVEWRVVIDGEAAGPFSASQVMEMITAGTVTDTQLAWKPGMDKWVEIKTVAPFDARFAPPLPIAASATAITAEPETPAGTSSAETTLTNLTFSSLQPGIVLHVREAGTAAQFRPLCTSPCAQSVAPGNYELALNVAGSKLARVRGIQTFAAGDKQLEGQYRSRRGARVTGAVLLGVFSAFGVGLVAMGVAFNLGDDGIIPFSVGLLSFGVSFGAGFPLLFQKPRANVLER